MKFEEAKKLNGKVICYRNAFGVECTGKVIAREIQKREGPGFWGREPVYPIRTVIINDLIGKDKCHSCWSTSTLDKGHEFFERDLAKITLLEILEETPSMRFSYESYKS